MFARLKGMRKKEFESLKSYFMQFSAKLIVGKNMSEKRLRMPDGMVC